MGRSRSFRDGERDRDGVSGNLSRVLSWGSRDCSRYLRGEYCYIIIVRGMFCSDGLLSK